MSEGVHTHGDIREEVESPSTALVPIHRPLFLPLPPHTPSPPPNETTSQVEPDELDMIDHVLLSSNLAQRVASVYMYHGYPEGCDILDSDHWCVRSACVPQTIDGRRDGCIGRWIDGVLN